eukprot:GEZU01042653.1.p1 GENE.GEZU01042653.1~~GEZU01042653.1.p1  ORF type:complete len:161 (-),score=25.48 GEZU01042653.1:653-1135(-)
MTSDNTYGTTSVELSIADKDDKTTVVWEGEWSPVRHFFKSVRQTVTSVASRTKEFLDQSHERFEERKAIASEHASRLPVLARSFKNDHPLIVTSTISAFVAWRSRNVFSSFGMFRNAILAFAGSSLLLYPRETVALLSNPKEVLQEQFNNKITEGTDQKQ